MYFDVNAYDYPRAEMFKRSYREQVATEIDAQKAYESVTGVASASVENIKINIEGREVVITLAQDAHVSITSIDGRELYSGTLSEGTSRITLPRGICIVSAGQSTRKVSIY